MGRLRSTTGPRARFGAPRFAVGLGLACGVARAADPPDPVAVPTPTTYDPSRSLAPLIQAVEPAVVSVVVQSAGEASPHAWLAEAGEGSGFVIAPDGLVLTNFHVVDGATAISLEWSDGTSRPARVVGGDVSLDVALLRVDTADPLPFVTLGDSDRVEVGDWVVAMGNGLGLGTTATAGIVSGKRRTLGRDPFGTGPRVDARSPGFIQTDAAINQGSSGGPLFDLDGHVVGMSTAIVTNANTVGFAIPSNLVTAILADLEARGRVARGFLGIAPQTLNPELRAALGVDASSGVVVTSVFAGTPAEVAGLRTGDVVVRIDGQPVTDGAELIATIGTRRPGDKVVLEVERDRRVRAVEVTLSEREVEAEVAPPPAPPVDALAAAGLVLAPASAEVLAAAGLRGAVRVDRVEAGTPADGKLAAGDLIVLVNRHPVSTADEVRRHLEAFWAPGRHPRGDLVLLVIRDDVERFVTLGR